MCPRLGEILQQPRGSALPVDGVVLPQGVHPGRLDQEHAGFVNVDRRFVLSFPSNVSAMGRMGVVHANDDFESFFNELVGRVSS